MAQSRRPLNIIIYIVESIQRLIQAWVASFPLCLFRTVVDPQANGVQSEWGDGTAYVGQLHWSHPWTAQLWGQVYVCWQEGTRFGLVWFTWRQWGESCECEAERGTRTAHWLIHHRTRPREPSLTSGQSHDPRQSITHIKKTWTSEHWSFKHAINGATGANIFCTASGMPTPPHPHPSKDYSRTCFVHCVHVNVSNNKDLQHKKQ